MPRHSGLTPIFHVCVYAHNPPGPGELVQEGVLPSETICVDVTDR